MNHKGYLFFGILLFLIIGGVFSQNSNLSIKQATETFNNGDYLGALSQYQKLTDAALSVKISEEAQLGLAKTYFALLDYSNSLKALNQFIQKYPNSKFFGDAIYLQGRIFLSQNNQDSAIQTFNVYLKKFPDGPLAANVIFWLGECSLNLGRYSEAKILYLRLLDVFPKSPRSEIAKSRLLVLEMKEREDELLKLLRWSHIEALNASDEFRRRENAYQQTIFLYQKKLTGQSIDNKVSDITSKTEFSNWPNEDGNKLKLLEIKNRALELKVFYLQWKAQHENK